MAFIGVIALILGFLVAAAGAVLMIVAAFRVSPLWGLGVMFIPLVPLIFLVSHWEKAKNGFLLQLLSIPIIILGTVTITAAGPGAAHDGGGQEDYSSRPQTSPRENPGGGTDFFSTSSAIPTAVYATPTALIWTPVPTITPAQPTPIPRPSPTARPITQLEDFMGYTIEFRLANGDSYRATLMRVEPDRVQVRRIMGGGSMTHWIRRDQIVGFDPRR